MMKIMHGTPLLACLLAGAGLAAVSLPLLAGVEAECRQEAEEYGIPPEQKDDYIGDCVLSRGGDYAIEAPVEDYNPPADVYETGETGEVSGDVPQ